MNFQTNAITETICILRVGNYLKNQNYEKQIPTYAQPFTKFETNIVLNLSSCVFIFYFLIPDCYIQLY